MVIYFWIRYSHIRRSFYVSVHAFFVSVNLLAITLWFCRIVFSCWNVFVKGKMLSNKKKFFFVFATEMRCQNEIKVCLNPLALTPSDTTIIELSQPCNISGSRYQHSSDYDWIRAKWKGKIKESGWKNKL